VTASTTYEQVQDFNALTRYLHSVRFRNLLTCLDELDRCIPDRPLEVLELGCGTGRAFEAMNDRCSINYHGVDIKPERIEAARERYAGQSNCNFIVGDAADPQLAVPGSADIVVALETLEHIPESAVVRIVEKICRIIRPRLFIASVPIEIGPAIWVKFLGSKAIGYDCRGPGYTWRYAFWAGLYNLNQVPTHGIKHLGFNWYWLEQTVRHNAKIRETRAMPFRWLPKWIAPNVMLIAEPQAVAWCPPREFSAHDGLRPARRPEDWRSLPYRSKS
jgi:SAM-dependent methyltransferase